MTDARTIPEIRIDVDEMYGNLTMPSKCSIFRIPTVLSRHSPNAFVPNQFSFGPFHHSTKTNQIYQIKVLARPHHSLFRSEASEKTRSPRDPDTVLVALTKAITDKSMVARECYSGSIDPVTITPIDQKSLLQVTVEFFDTIFSVEPLPVELIVSHQFPPKHILDLLRNSLIFSFRRHVGISPPQFSWEPIPSATILEESGIKIRKGDSSLVNIGFNTRKHILIIPPLMIHDATEAIFRNLISLEQLCPNYDPIITSYAHLLGNLINNANDIEILSKSGVLLNWLDVQNPEFFNKLFIGTAFRGSCYTRLSRDIKVRCRSVWPRYRMLLLRYYFNNPWALISLSVAAYVFVCTFLQTFYTSNHHLWAHILLISVAVLVACSLLKTLFTFRKSHN